MSSAIHRRIEEELHISVRNVRLAVPSFRYRAIDASGVVENEICPVYIAVTDNHRFTPNPAEVMDYSWAPWERVVEAIEATPQVYSPWAVMQVPELSAALRAEGIDVGGNWEAKSGVDSGFDHVYPERTLPSLSAAMPEASQDSEAIALSQDLPLRALAHTSPGFRDVASNSEEPLGEPSAMEHSSPAARRSDRRVPTMAETLQSVAELVDEGLSRVEARWQEFLYDEATPVTTHGEDLPAWARRLMDNGGKRLRTRMVHWGYVAAGGTNDSPGYKEAIQAAAALETLHLFALIHDDVMDASRTRRGEPAAHVEAASQHLASDSHGDSHRHGTNIAILLGDLVYAVAEDFAHRLSPVLYNQWRDLVVELMVGQRSDLTEASKCTPDYAHAKYIADLKSGSYTVTRPLLLGASAAGAGEAQLASLADYGKHVGHAFAARDDFLGVWGDPQFTGKPADDDLRNGKITLVLDTARESFGGGELLALERLGTPKMHDSDIATVRQALTDHGTAERLEHMIQASTDSGLAALDDAILSPDGIVGLTDMSTAIAWRKA